MRKWHRSTPLIGTKSTIGIKNEAGSLFGLFNRKTTLLHFVSIEMTGFSKSLTEDVLLKNGKSSHEKIYLKSWKGRGSSGSGKKSYKRMKANDGTRRAGDSIPGPPERKSAIMFFCDMACTITVHWKGLFFRSYSKIRCGSLLVNPHPISIRMEYQELGEISCDNIINRMEASFSTQYMQLFETLWNDREKMQNVTEPLSPTLARQLEIHY